MVKGIKNSFNNIINHKYFFYYVYYFFLLLGSIVTILFVSRIKIFAYFPILWIGLGWSITFLKSRVSLLENLLLSIIVFIVLYTSYAGILLLIGIPVTIITAVLFFIISSLIFLFNKTFERKNIMVTISREEVLLYFVLSVSFIAKVISIRGMTTPNLSDELTHSYFSKLIVETGHLPTYYSPGIHTFFALGTQLGGFGVVHQVLYVTNLMSVYAGIPVYFFLKNVLKQRIGAIVACGLFSLGYPLLSLFYFSGKNALIFAVSILLFSFFVNFLSNKYKSRSLSILSVLVLFSSFVIHYPTAVFVSIFWGCTFLANLKKKWKYNIFTGIGAIAGILFMMVLLYKYTPSNFSSSSQISVGIDAIEKIKEFYLLVKNGISESVFNIYPILFIICCLLGIFWTNFKILKDKNNRWYLVLFLWTILSLLFVLMLTVFSIKSLFILTETYVLLLFIYLYIYVALGISLIYKCLEKYLNKEIVFTIFVILFSSIIVLVGTRAYRRCVEKKEYNIVKEQDLDVFNWLDINTSDSEKILINSYSIIPGLILPSDSGGWITLFSDNMVSSPFWDFQGEITFKNYMYYENLVENIDDCIAKNYFIDNGYRYYFKGSIPLGRVIGDRDKLINSGWDLLYESDNSSIYRIPVCKLNQIN